MTAAKELDDILRVGVIGADIHKRGFGARAHLPGVLGAPGLELAAICTAHPETAEQSAKEYLAKMPAWESR